LNIFQMDELIFQYFNGMAVTISILNPVMRFLSEKAEYLFYLGIVVYWFTRSRKNRQLFITALVSACVGFGVGQLFSYFFYRDRPFVQGTVNQLIEHSANASFPSDHAIGAFVIATAIYLFRKKDGIIWLVLGGLIALSRIWNGVHYPSDVVAGALIGVISAYMIYQIVHRWSAAHKWLNTSIDLFEKIEEKMIIRYKKTRQFMTRNK